MKRFSSRVVRELGYYVYVYVDPATDEVFYVGKGRGNRAFSHLDEDADSAKVGRIRTIRERGEQPVIEILAHGIPAERAAYRLECAAIDLLGVGQLTNVVRGWRSGTYGRMPVEQVEAMYGAREVAVKHSALLIRINRLFRYGMSEQELYDVTRGVWRLGPRRELAKYAFAVFDGIVQEVYRIRGWYPAGSTLTTRGDLEVEGRWEFVGSIAKPAIRKRHRLRAVREYLASGSQSPIVYVNCDGPE